MRSARSLCKQQRGQKSAGRNSTVAPGQSVGIQRGRSRICCAPAAELHPGATIPSNEARAVPPMQATRLGIPLLGSVPPFHTHGSRFPVSVHRLVGPRQDDCEAGLLVVQFPTPARRIATQKCGGLRKRPIF
jgi:hypothetical protein